MVIKLRTFTLTNQTFCSNDSMHHHKTTISLPDHVIVLFVPIQFGLGVNTQLLGVDRSTHPSRRWNRAEELRRKPLSTKYALSLYCISFILSLSRDRSLLQCRLEPKSSEVKQSQSAPTVRLQTLMVGQRYLSQAKSYDGCIYLIK